MPPKYIFGDLDKPFHRPECECPKCEEWRAMNEKSVTERLTAERIAMFTFFIRESKSKFDLRTIATELLAEREVLLGEIERLRRAIKSSARYLETHGGHTEPNSDGAYRILMAIAVENEVNDE